MRRSEHPRNLAKPAAPAGHPDDGVPPGVRAGGPDEGVRPGVPVGGPGQAVRPEVLAGAPEAAARLEEPVWLPRRATISSVALFVLLGVATASLGAALPAIRVSYPAGASSGGRLVSLYMLGSLIAIAVGGLGERKLPPARAIVSLVGVFAAGCFGIGLAPTWMLLQLATVAAGAGFGGLALYINTAFVQAFGGRNLVLLNLLNAAYGAGAVIGPVLAGLPAHLGLRLVFPACGLLAIGCLPVRDCSRALAHPAPAPTARNQTGLETPKLAASKLAAPKLAALKILVPFAVIGFLYDGLETGTGAWQSTHLVWIGYSVTSAAQVAGLFWAGLLAGRLIIPIFTTRFSPSAIALGGFATAAIALGGASLPWLAPYGYAFAGFGLATVFPAMLAMTSQTAVSPQFANGVMLSACMIGGVIWPAVIGLVAHPSLPATIPLTLAGISVLCLLAVWNAVRANGQGQEISHS